MRPVPSVTASAVEELARRLAGENGVCWANLSDYPGFQKFIWREKAAEVFAAAGMEIEPEEEDEYAAEWMPRFLS